MLPGSIGGMRQLQAKGQTPKESELQPSPISSNQETVQNPHSAELQGFLVATPKTGPPCASGKASQRHTDKVQPFCLSDKKQLNMVRTITKV